jgi:Bacterial Ig-like domain (group 2)
MTAHRAYRARAVLLAAVLAAACTDRTPTGSGTTDPPAAPDGPSTTVAALECTARMDTREVECRPPAPRTGAAAGDVIVGGQGVYVQLTSSNLTYDSGTGVFTFDATLQNLIEQPLGTLDGTSMSPSRIFFFTGPTMTVGSGSVAVVPDGFAFFTEAAQAYYTYGHLLTEGSTSPAHTWTFIVPPTVTRFVFTVYVSSPVEYPDGYITLNGELPDYAYGPVHPSAPLGLTAVIKNFLGEAVPGVVTFGTSDAACATVDGAGTVTGVRAGSCTITATSGAYGGAMAFDVTGTTRAWNGSLSADWSVGANWDGGYTPAAADSVTIPLGVPNFPALVAATPIGGVDVADGATLSLGAFDLTASANVATGATPGSGIVGAGGVLELAGAAMTVRGRVPSLRVTGEYSLSGDLDVVAPGRVVAGGLRSTSYLMRTVAQ